MNCHHRISLNTSSDGVFYCGGPITIPRCVVTNYDGLPCSECQHGYLYHEQNKRCQRILMPHCIEGAIEREASTDKTREYCYICRTGYTKSVDGYSCVKNGEGETIEGCLAQFQIKSSKDPGQIKIHCQYCGFNKTRYGFDVCKNETCEEGCYSCYANGTCHNCQTYLNYYEYEKGKCRYMAPPEGFVNILANPNATIPEDDSDKKDSDSKDSEPSTRISVLAFLLVFYLAL